MSAASVEALVLTLAKLISTIACVQAASSADTSSPHHQLLWRICLRMFHNSGKLHRLMKSQGNKNSFSSRLIALHSLNQLLSE